VLALPPGNCIQVGNRDWRWSTLCKDTVAATYRHRDSDVHPLPTGVTVIADA
jgi:hypothetical protein